MKLSPAQRHREKVLAKRAVKEARLTGVIADAAESLHLQLIALEEDIKRLRKLDRIADKAAMKKNELLPKYRPYVERYLEQGEVYQNQLFAHVIVWLFDTEELGQGIAWALLAIEQNQPTPDNFRSNWPHFVADTVLKWCEVQSEQGNSVEPYCSQVFNKVRNDWRLKEIVTAKWFKFCGTLLLRDINGKPLPSAIEDVNRLEQAYSLLAEANNFHSKIGVRTLMDKIDMRIRALTDK